MPEVMLTHTNGFDVTLDEDEMQTVLLHSTRESLTMANGLADLLERSFIDFAQALESEEFDNAKHHTDDSLTIMLHVGYPKEGPLSTFDGTEKGLIAKSLLECLDICIQAIKYNRHLQENINVVERKDEGMGTGESPIP